jgi:hypothetical protein
MKKLVRDYEGERQGLKQLEGAAYKVALFENVHQGLLQLAKAGDKQEKYEALADLQELYSTLVSAVMPKNPAAYEALTKIAQDKGVDQGGFFKGYFTEVLDAKK